MLSLQLQNMAIMFWWYWLCAVCTSFKGHCLDVWRCHSSKNYGNKHASSIEVSQTKRKVLKLACIAWHLWLNPPKLSNCVAVISPVEGITVETDTLTSTSFEMKWKPALGLVDGYNITLHPNSGGKEWGPKALWLIKCTLVKIVRHCFVFGCQHCTICSINLYHLLYTVNKTGN